MHTGTAKDFASHGYIVFIMDHRDTTSSYIQEKDGTGQYYDNSHMAYDYDIRREQIKIREKEVIAFIDELYDQDTLMK
jgi:alpha-beta hydrolase superfamily lysophospholipase